MHLADTCTMASSPVRQTFVLGLDGIPWNLLARWADEGKLPNVKRLMESGASGPLESTIPPTTAVAWPSITTGVRADKHGIYSFRSLTSEYGRHPNTSNALKEPPLWEMLSPAVVGNVPMTYPATDFDGTMISGMMTPDRAEGFTSPPDLADELESEVPDYEIGLAWHEYHGREEAFLEDLEAMVESRRKLMHYLLETQEWSLFFFVYTAPDRLQHLIWDTEVILDHYRQLDQILGEVMTTVEEADANLFVVSDHGFGPVSSSIHVNTILEEAGYLTRKSPDGTRSILGRVGIEKDAVRSLLQKTRLEKPLLSVVPDRLINDVANHIPGDHGIFDVSFPETEAFAFGGRKVYVNDSLRFADGPVPPAARHGVKQEVKGVLETVTHPETGEELLDVHDGSRLFPTDPQAPDLVVQSPAGMEVSTSLAENIVEPLTERAGGHRSKGIFLAWGPNIAKTRITDATVYDIAPTILQSQLETIPRDVDGRVLDIFDADSSPGLEAPSFTDVRRGSRVETPDSDFGPVEERLRGLGYLE